MEITIAPENVALGTNSVDNINLDALPTVPGAAGNESGNDQNPQTPLDIDEQFKGLPEEEARFRTIQSRYDKLYPQHVELVNKVTEYESALEIMDDLMEDDEALYAFLNERKPELLQTKDIGTKIKETLVKEFGDGYKPELTREQAETQDPGGTDWRYYKRLDDLYTELKTGSGYTKVASLKAYRAKKEALKREDEGRHQQQIERARVDLKMTDDEIQRTSDYWSKRSFADLTKILRYLARVQAPVGNISTVQGSPVPSSTARSEFVNSLKR